MRTFHCQRCDHRLDFDSRQCPQCQSHQGFVLATGRLVVIDPVDGALFEAAFEPGAPRSWRCLNAAWGCNWLVPAVSTASWCESCRLTRGRPDEADLDAVRAWSAAEAQKRLLVHQLHELALPIGARSDGVPDGLAFDLVYVPGAPAVTGHRKGIVTIDLTEHDDSHRETVRADMGESYRTLLGHLRHEVGHYYWTLLIDRRGRQEEFRRCFGDERIAYDAALQHHYGRNLSADLDPAYISAYAASHPWEDWAETFAHYLHITDTLDTAHAVGLRVEGGGEAPALRALVESENGFPAAVAVWVRLADAVNAVSRSMGERGVYPFVLTPQVVEKLSFVHDCVRRK
jgi:hypothetical protein